MHDIKRIRDVPNDFDQQLSKRKIPPSSRLIIDLDLEKRQRIHSLETLKSSLNSLAKEFGKKKASGESLELLQFKEETQIKKQEIQNLEKDIKSINNKLDRILYSLPNSPEEDIPIGENEIDNLEVCKWGKIKDFNFQTKEHFEVPAASGLDFRSSSKISGSRFTVLSGGVATLHRALSQFMINTHIREHKLKEVSTPVLVKEHAMLGTGQLPKFESESYKTANGWWLIPTAEVTLTNLKAGIITPLIELPERLCAVTQCFRSEAGSAGKDTTGMLRQHQFEKVEMVTFSPPNMSNEELERMTQCAENILQKLELPYRKILLCTGDMGFSSKKTYDLEVWLPGQNRYREISSISNCGDFQARRMNARYRTTSENKPDFLHTLNGSGLAVGRCLIALIENYQTEDGKVEIPKCLTGYLSGAKFLNTNGELE